MVSPRANERAEPNTRDAVPAVRLVAFTPLGLSLLWQSITAVPPKFEVHISNCNIEIIYD